MAFTWFLLSLKKGNFSGNTLYMYNKWKNDIVCHMKTLPWKPVRIVTWQKHWAGWAEIFRKCQITGGCEYEKSVPTRGFVIRVPNTRWYNGTGKYRDPTSGWYMEMEKLKKIIPLIFLFEKCKESYPLLKLWLFLSFIDFMTTLRFL